MKRYQKLKLIFHNAEKYSKKIGQHKMSIIFNPLTLRNDYHVTSP